MGSLGLFYFFLLSVFSLSIVPLSPAHAAQSAPSAGGELTNTSPTHYSHRAFDDPEAAVNAQNLQLIAPAAGDDTNIQQAEGDGNAQGDQQEGDEQGDAQVNGDEPPADEEQAAPPPEPIDQTPDGSEGTTEDINSQDD